MFCSVLVVPVPRGSTLFLSVGCSCLAVNGSGMQGADVPKANVLSPSDLCVPTCPTPATRTRGWGAEQFWSLPGLHTVLVTACGGMSRRCSIAQGRGIPGENVRSTLHSTHAPMPTTESLQRSPGLAPRAEGGPPVPRRPPPCSSLLREDPRRVRDMPLPSSPQLP